MDWESKDAVGRIVAQTRAQIMASAVEGPTISQLQKATLKESKVKGPMWVSKFTLPVAKENDHVRTLLLGVIDMFNDGDRPYARPDSEPIDIEWIGYRKGAGKDAPEPLIPEDEKYARLVKDTSSPAVVMFIYGGAFYSNGPASYRKIISKLAQFTGGRCMIVRQRLAPQNPFPAALLDVFHGYMSLLSPPPGSPHNAIPASSIVLAGDSSGACLALGLLQVLLTLRRQNPALKIDYHGSKVDVTLPAGLTLLSAVGDLTNGLPAYRINAPCDFFPPGMPPTLKPTFPTCDIWPSTPPRGNIYCDSHMLYHPIASPTASLDWTGSPPLWFASGQEQIVDGAKVIAQTAFGQGVTVVFQEYEAMPHIFMWRFVDSPQAQKCWIGWADACKRLGEGKSIISRGILVEMKGLRVKEVDLTRLTPLTADDAGAIMKGAAHKYKIFTGRKEGGAVL